MHGNNDECHRGWSGIGIQFAGTDGDGDDDLRGRSGIETNFAETDVDGEHIHPRAAL